MVLHAILEIVVSPQSIDVSMNFLIYVRLFCKLNQKKTKPIWLYLGLKLVGIF